MKNIYILYIAAGVAIAALLPSPAHAYKVGNIDVKTFGTASGMYDSNVTYVKDNRKTDYVTGLVAGVTGTYEGKLTQMQFAGSVNQQLFAENPTYNNTAENLTFTLADELSRFDHITLREVFNHSYEPRSFEDEFGRTSGRYSFYRNNINLDYKREITKQLELNGRAANSIDIPSLSTIKDSYYATAGADLDYYVSSASILIGGYDAAIRYFEGGKQALTNRLSGGFRQFITKQLYLDGRAGADFIYSFNKTDYVKPRFSVSLTDDIDQNTQGTIGFTREFNTNSYSQDLFDYWQVSASGRKAVTERFRVSGNCFFGHGEYVSGAIKDDLYGLNLQASYDFTPHITGTVSYNISSTVSNLDLREYLRNAVYFGLTATY